MYKTNNSIENATPANIRAMWSSRQTIPADINKREYLHEEWKSVRPSEKLLLTNEREQMFEQGVDEFIAKYLDRDTYSDEYKSSFRAVKKEAKSLLESTMNIAENRDFFVQVEKLVAEKRASVEGFKLWQAETKGKRVDFDKLKASQKQQAAKKAAEHYATSLKEVNSYVTQSFTVD